ncbi:MAG: efflux RND transporter permease subunit [Victivallaceae bacterium]|nr:efflux RND transporter permease subunit [Victivallaceae bacterium]
MITDLFVNRPKLSMVISILIVIAGLLSLFTLPVAEYPEIAPPAIMVRASYPGASSQVIADTIAAIVEAEVNGVEDMIYYSSESDNNGGYTLTLTFKPGTNTDIAQVNVQNAVKRAEPRLPSEVVALGINVFKRSSDILGMFVFTSENPKIGKLELSNYVKTNVKDALSRIDGVSDVMIYGELQYSMRIWLDSMHMNALGVHPNDIVSALQTQNIQAATGSIGSEGSNDLLQFKINTTGRLRTPEEFGRIIVKSGEDGRQIRVSDVARVELGASEYSSASYYNGKDSVSMGIYRSDDANANDVIKLVTGEVERISKHFPEGVKYKLGYDPTEYIRTTLEEIVWTLVLTLILVVVITYLFLQDWRATLVPTLAIPISIIGTFSVLAIMGYSINVLTMFALILVIGSVVDDAIVVVENCMRLIQEEKLSPHDAAIKTMRQVAGALIATTLVVVAVYAPLGFYSGMVGVIYRQFAVTMCTALCFSTLVAFTLSPVICSLILRPYKENKMFRPFNLLLEKSRGIYLFFAGMLTRRLALTLILFAGVLGANYLLFKRTPNGFLPQEDKGAIFSDVQLPPGASIKRTCNAMLRFSEEVGKIPGVRDVICVAGFSMLGGNGENQGMIITVLDDWGQRPTKDLAITAVKAKIDAQAQAQPWANINSFVPPAIMGLGVTGGASFVLEATAGQDAQELAGATRAFMGVLNQQPYMQYAFSTYEAGTPQLFLDLDRAKCEALHVPVNRVFSTLQNELASYYVNDFNLGGYAYKVKLQAEKRYRTSVSNVLDINVRNDAGQMVPLSAIATVSSMVGPRQIMRFTQFPSASFQTAQKLNSISSGELMNRIEKMAQETLPPGYQIGWTDMSYQERGNEGKILFLMSLALLFGYLFLVAQYESWTVPLSVILTVAVATLGAFLGVWAFGLSLTIYAQLGLVMLIGLSSKSAILMVEFSKMERERGLSVVDAALSGASQRYRAVLMTAWSFVLGVVPMVFATGAGAGSRVDIGVTTCIGMIFATVFGIVFIPGLYAVFQYSSEFIAKFFSNGSEKA